MKKKVLIIDDNDQDRKIIKRFLDKAGFKDLIFAENGEEGVKKAKSEKPDLVITDTMLPGINGFEVCRQVKAIPGPAIPKVIVVTGSVDAVDAGKARSAGADDYVVKVSDLTALVSAVEKLFGAA